MKPAHALMNRWFLGLLLLPALCATAAADYTYTFTTTTAAPSAGPVTGKLTVPDWVIADGTLLPSAVTSFEFSLADATSPFVAMDLTSSDSSIQNYLGTPIAVDPGTGRFLGNGSSLLLQLNGSEQVVVIQASEFATYTVEAPQGQMASGGGTWTVARTLTQIPEPTSAALAMLTLTAFVGRSRRG